MLDSYVSPLLTWTSYTNPLTHLATGIRLHYMSIDMLLERLDDEEALPGSNLWVNISTNSIAKLFTLDLLETEYFTPKVLSDLFELRLPFATSLHIIQHAREEVQHICKAFFSGDQSVVF